MSSRLTGQMIEIQSKEAPEMLDRLVRLHPIGGLGKAIEIAYGILFLVSENSSFMTGSEMIIDGSYTCR